MLSFSSWSQKQQHTTIQQPLSLSVPSPASTWDGRVGLRNVSVHQVHLLGWGQQSRFWGVSSSSTTTRFVPSLFLAFARSSSRHMQGSSWLPNGTASIGMTTSAKAPCLSLVLPALPQGTRPLTILLFCWSKHCWLVLFGWCSCLVYTIRCMILFWSVL
jgi:hypothetical protein